MPPQLLSQLRLGVVMVLSPCMLLLPTVPLQELAAAASDASRPLLRQIEALSSQLAAAQSSATKADWATQARLRDAEAAAALAVDGKRQAVARATAAESALAAARDAAVTAAATAAELRAQLAAVQRRVLTIEAERNAAEERLAAAVSQEREAVAALERVRVQSSEKLWEAEQKLRLLAQERDELQQQLSAAATAAASADGTRPGSAAARAQMPSHATTSSGATASNGHSSGHDNTSCAAIAAAEAGNGYASPAYRHQSTSGADEASSLASLLSQTSFKGTPSNRTDSTIETARMRRAVDRLQQELATAQSERDAATEQLLAALKGAEGAAALRQQLQEVQHRADIALEIIGEWQSVKRLLEIFVDQVVGGAVMLVPRQHNDTYSHRATLVAIACAQASALCG